MNTTDELVITSEIGYTRILLPDAIGMASGDEYFQKIMGALEAGTKILVLDLAQTTVIYSSGFGLLIRIRKILAEDNGVVCLVNVSEKVGKFFTDFNLDRIFKIYSTDVEFELEHGDIWKSKFTENPDAMIFAAQNEGNVCRITISGQVTALNDFSPILNFKPDPVIHNFIVNFENMEIIDTYGSQLCNDLIGRIRSSGGKCVLYGLKNIASDLFELFSDLRKCVVCKSEEEALVKIKV